MEWALRQLSLGALKSNWNVLRTADASTLISTWYFGEEETIGVIGQLSHISFVNFGGAASVNFSIQRNTPGIPQRTSSKLSRVSLDTLQSMSPSVGLNLGWDCWLRGIHATGFLSAAELDVYTRVLHYQALTSQTCWARSSVNGVQAWDMSVRYSSTPQPTANDE